MDTRARRSQHAMKRWWRVVPFTLALTITLVSVTPAAPSGLAAGPIHTHSGRVVAIDVARGVLLLDEVGPWNAKARAVQMIRRTILLLPTTDYVIALRANPREGFPGSFIEGQMDPEAIEPGSVVTVECLHEGPRLIARTVTLVSTADP